MKLIKKKIYRLFNLLSKKKKANIFLFLLLIANGISESISLLTIIPFLSLILSGGDLNNFINLNININKYLPTSIKSYNEILFFLTGIFCFFILFSTILRIINNWYILRLTAKIGIDLSDNIFRNNIYQSYIEYTKKSSSKIIYLVNDAVGACQSALNSLFTITLTSIIGFSIIITVIL